MSKGNVTQNLTPAASGAIERFDPRRATEFAQKPTSEETRRAYSRVAPEFFAAIGNLDPRPVGPAEAQEWRDKLQRKRQKAATISFKLSVARAFFGYPKALGLVERNPADAKLVMPPTLPEQMAGRALTPDEVNGLLAGPDRRKQEVGEPLLRLLFSFEGALAAARAQRNQS